MSGINPDYYTNVRQCQRFIFENNLYLFEMFDRKVDSFLSNKTKKHRERERELIHNQHIIDPDSILQDPLKLLAKDLTKPVWNCTTKTRPTALCLLPTNELSNGTVCQISHTMARFLERYKSEHEDESSLRVGLQFINKQANIEKIQQLISNKSIETNEDEPLRIWWGLMQELFSYLIKIKEKQAQHLESRQGDIDFQQVYGMAVIQARAEHEILERMQEKDQNNHYLHPQLQAEALNLIMVLRSQFKSVVESTNGASVIVYCPQLGLLPELVHPLLLGIYCFIKAQALQDILKQQKLKNMNNPLGPIPSETNIQTEQAETVFDEMRNGNYSKITFLNLDGYESPYNTYIAKYLSKYLQYISFPLEEDELLKDSSLQQYFLSRSQRLVKQYLWSELNEEERELEFKIFKVKEKTEKEMVQFYKRLFIFPVNSIYLQNRYTLGNVELFQSNFILFVLREMVYIQLKEFNPSMIVISYSGKLTLQNEHFIEMIRELTIISGMRLVLYCNLAKSYLYKQPLPEDMQQTYVFHGLHKYYNKRYEQRIGLLRNNSINYDIFHKISIFLKMSSGTHSLTPTVEEDSAIEKYCNYNILKYGGRLFKLLGKNHPVLEKVRSRGSEYLKIQRIMANYYQSQTNPEQKAFALIPEYYFGLIDEAEKEITHQSQSFKHLYELIHAKYGAIRRDSDQWQHFLYRYKLELLQEKNREESKFYARLPRYQPQKKLEEEQDANFIALQFQIPYQQANVTVSISPHSQVCYDSRRKHSKALVYLFNHLPFRTELSLKSYCGVIDETIDDKFDTKVKLREIKLLQNVYSLNPYQTFTQFNYHQTERRILLFWPIIYDIKLALLHRFAHSTYEPQTTNLIFIATREQPFLFTAVQPQSPEYRHILPRSGCTCFQVPNTDSIYVFGGFYHNQQNYLAFQVDITLINYQQDNGILKVINVPKQFHLSCEQIKPDLHKITGLYNDFVRPRIEYEVYPLEEEENIDTVQILLLGGVGARFMRPYSLLGYMGHHIVFDKTGKIGSIGRIKLNGAVPINLKRPVKTGALMEMDAIQHAQNRLIYSRKVTVPLGTPTYSWNHLSHSHEEDKMTFRREYQFGIPSQERQQLGDGSVQLRENGQTITTRTFLRHYYGRSQNSKVLILSCDQGFNEILNVGLHLRPEVYERFVNMPSDNVLLDSSNIVALDVCGLDVYALIEHQEYTCGRYVLAHLDLAANVQRIMDEEDYNIFLEQVYEFDHPLPHHIVKALSARKVAIVHGRNFCPIIAYQQMMIKRSPRGLGRSEQIYNCLSTEVHNLWEKSIPQGNQISFFIEQKDLLLCLTFKTISRSPEQEELYFAIDSLEEIGEQPINRWSTIKECLIRFQIHLAMANEQTGEGHISLIDLRRCDEDKKYQLIVSYKETICIGSFNWQTDEVVQFRSTSIQVGDCWKEILSEKGQNKYAVPLYKGRPRYERSLYMDLEGNG